MRLKLDIPTTPARPQTIDQAYDRFVGRGLEEPNWDAFEEAVGKIVDGSMPTEMGHHPDCMAGKYPMGLHDVMSKVIDGEPAAVCIHCGYQIA